MNKNWFKNLQNKISNKEIGELQYIFYTIAKDLMNNYILKIDNLKLELTEIEFYYFECNYHKDLYVHLDELQKESGLLYVHKKGKGYGGIDLTFGNNNYFGGILIRGIKDVKNNNFISGPAKIREYIATNLKINNEYKDIQKNFKTNKQKIILEKKDNVKEKYDILHSIRIGLNSEINEEFYNALYRFVRLDNLEAKDFLTYKNLKDRSKLKAISNITGICTKFPNEKSTIKNIEKNEILKNNIIKFKKYQEKEVNKN
jgi:3-methyladenine DNA glycosylase Mpg